MLTTDEIIDHLKHGTPISNSVLIEEIERLRGLAAKTENWREDWEEIDNKGCRVVDAHEFMDPDSDSSGWFFQTKDGAIYQHILSVHQNKHLHNLVPRKKPKQSRPWKSVEEMGKAVDHWFRKKGFEHASRMNRFWPDGISTFTEFLPWDNLFRDYEHSAVASPKGPWLLCGIEVGE